MLDISGDSMERIRPMRGGGNSMITYSADK